MRLEKMNRLSVVLASVALAGAVLPLGAQRAVPAGSGDTFKDTSTIKPPAGQKIAIYEFEDLECPACAVAHPTVVGAAEHYKLPLVRKDFPWSFHVWSTDAAIWARYLQDKVSPSTAADYRTAVFAAQQGIASKDDLMAFTRRFFQQHGLPLPFVVDPDGRFAKEVMEDKALGDKIGIRETPTIFVCTQHEWVQVTTPTDLYQTIDQVESDVRAGR
jgi:protein-disulfide isomerase